MSTPTTTSTPANDADLEDLLQENTSKNQHLEMTPLNLDHVTQKAHSINAGGSSSPKKQHTTSTTSSNNTGSCLSLVQASCTYMAYAHPKLCGTCILGGIAALLFLLLSSIMNPTIYFGQVEHDYSNIQSQFDLKQGMIDHWCLRGDDNSCRCEDPLTPQSRAEFSTWRKAHSYNKHLLDSIQNEKHNIQVAFVGESLVEEMNGRWMGQARGTTLVQMKNMFDQRFNSSESNVNGIALGIAGDTSPNVFWRLLHGEMPDWFSPNIWWISLGMNDLGRMQCSEEVVVIGILRVVEEILNQKPNARVVINSMLPMADLRGGIYPHVRDYKDAIQQNSKASHYVKMKKNDDGKRLLKKRRKEEDEEGEDAQNPEKLDKKTLKRYRKKDPVNPVLDPNETKMKKYHLLKKNRLPLWTSIYAINKELKKFCNKHDRVTFFDATNIFADRVERGKYMLKSDMISIRGHPSVAGYKAWEDAMLKKLKTMLADDKEKDETDEIVKYEIGEDEDVESSMEESVGDDKKKGSSSSSSSRPAAKRKKHGHDSSSSESSENPSKRRND